MRDHGVEDPVVVGARIGQTELCGQRFLGAQPVTRRNSGPLVQPLQFRTIRRSLEIFVTLTSAPDSRRISRVLRDVPQAGLW